MPSLKNKNGKKLKVAVIHAFFVPKGGGEKLIFDIRDHYQADLFTGAIDFEIWDKNKTDSDSFAKALYDKNYNLVYLHEDSKIPFWRKILRQWHFLFNPKIKDLAKYDLVIFSGNIAFVGARIKKINPNVKLVMYCHTPPRPFTDQLTSVLESKPFWLRPLFHLFSKWVILEYKKELKTMDLVISNSKNTQNRLKKYVGIDSVSIFPAANTNRFNYQEAGDYFISWGRIEPLKRIPLIVEAFAKMPDKKLIICSTGPLKDWLIEQIKTRNLTNIIYKGLVTDEELSDLVGKSLAGIYIPVDEDAGMTPIEIMAAGKPVLGVNEGGLTESILDGKTGILIPANPTIEDLISGINKITPELSLSMKDSCIARAKEYDSAVFFENMNNQIDTLFNNQN
jgi:glycosyltransferase involved in cell wall biosynthesis